MQSNCPNQTVRGLVGVELLSSWSPMASLDESNQKKENLAVSATQGFPAHLQLLTKKQTRRSE